MMPYRHIHAKMKKRQESIQKIEQLFFKPKSADHSGNCRIYRVFPGKYPAKVKRIKTAGQNPVCQHGQKWRLLEDVSTGIHTGVNRQRKQTADIEKRIKTSI